MKEILKEWREYLKETKRTEKYFGQPTHPKSTRTKLSPKYDRAVTKAAAQKDFRGTFKVWFGQFLKSNHRKGRMEFLISKMSDEEKQQAARDLNIMRYIYSGRSPYEITGRNNVRTGTLYDDQPEVVGSPVEKIDALLNDMDMQVTQMVPTDKDMEEVYIYYIKPNYATVLEPEPKEPKANPFASQMGWSADKLAQMNKDLWLKNKRKK